MLHREIICLTVCGQYGSRLSVKTLRQTCALALPSALPQICLPCFALGQGYAMYLATHPNENNG